jgi:hypothetical protein
MAKDSELARLRAEALKRERAAGKKMSRLRRQFTQTGDQVGPELRGTEFDPTVGRERINRYTKAQLRAHIERVNGFVDRGTQFVGAGDRSPITYDEWAEYKGYEGARNEIARAIRADRENLFIGPAGMTVEERKRLIEIRRNNRGRNPAVNAPDDIVEREPFSLAKASGLRKLIDVMKAKLAPDYDQKQREAAHDQFIGMMDRVENDEIREAVEQLTSGQFDILWNDTSFATALGTVYEILKAQAKGPVTPAQARQREQQMTDQMEMVNDLIAWAKRLPR